MHSSLLTDYYQLSMAEVYLERGLCQKASFEFFVRRLPASRNFLVACGLQQALDYLSGLRFSRDELSYLKELGFSSRLLEYLEGFSFSGDVWAMPEGTLFFADEPVVRIEAPLVEAQLVETRLMNILHFQTLVASKAARLVLSARGRPVIDFGFRRSHEADAGLFAARACHVAGFSATATVEAGRLFGIPVSGTMAHSFVLAHSSEEEAFRNFIESNPAGPILLIDTFDVIEAARLAARLHGEYGQKGISVRGVRIDSGDLLELSSKVRAIFHEEGCPDMKIFASGGLDEYSIQALMRAGAPIDGFGVGTLVDTSADAPYLDCAYKMVEYEGKPRMKLSKGKATLPFRKQVFRHLDQGGFIVRDVIGRAEDRLSGIPLLVKVVEKGRVLVREDLGTVRRRVQEGLSSLPHRLTRLESAAEGFVPEIASSITGFLGAGKESGGFGGGPAAG